MTPFFFTSMGLQLRVFNFFPLIEIMVIRQVILSPAFNSCPSFVCMCFHIEVGKDQNTPNWDSMAVDYFTWASIGDLGSPIWIWGIFRIERKPLG